MRPVLFALLCAFLLVGCGGPSDNMTAEQKKTGQDAQQKQAEDDELQSRKASDDATKKAKKK